MEFPGGKAKVEDNTIHAFIYDQEGKLNSFRLRDTGMNRLFIEWLQRHDRYNGQ